MQVYPLYALHIYKNAVIAKLNVAIVQCIVSLKSGDVSFGCFLGLKLYVSQQGSKQFA